jgi:hypothetical protein
MMRIMTWETMPNASRMIQIKTILHGMRLAPAKYA